MKASFYLNTRFEWQMNQLIPFHNELELAGHHDNAYLILIFIIY